MSGSGCSGRRAAGAELVSPIAAAAAVTSPSCTEVAVVADLVVAELVVAALHEVAVVADEATMPETRCSMASCRQGRG